MEDSDVCEQDFIREVLASIGWHNSFVPIASEDNKTQLEIIKCVSHAKVERNQALDDRGKEVSRVRVLLHSADNEFDQSLKLLTAHKSQYTTEHHLFKLSEHDDSRFRESLNDTVKLLKEQEFEQENLKGNQSLIYQIE